MKKRFQLPAILLAALLGLSSVIGVTAQEASPEASPEAANYGTPLEALDCWSEAPETDTAGYAQYAGVPEMKIDPAKAYFAEVETNRGTFVIQLYADVAPSTVNNFVCLATNNYYDGVTFHRIMRDFMIQTGDPTGTGRGGPGYQFNDELPGEELNYTEYTVAMANAGPNTNGSQWFVNTANNRNGLQRAYTIFGTVVEGQDVVDKIEEVPVSMNAQGEMSVPAVTITILNITITEK